MLNFHEWIFQKRICIIQHVSYYHYSTKDAHWIGGLQYSQWGFRLSQRRSEALVAQYRTHVCEDATDGKIWHSCPVPTSWCIQEACNPLSWCLSHEWKQRPVAQHPHSIRHSFRAESQLFPFNRQVHIRAHHCCYRYRPRPIQHSCNLGELGKISCNSTRRGSRMVSSL